MLTYLHIAVGCLRTKHKLRYKQYSGRKDKDSTFHKVKNEFSLSFSVHAPPPPITDNKF
jgi:hypothetical protein